MTSREREVVRVMLSAQEAYLRRVTDHMKALRLGKDPEELNKALDEVQAALSWLSVCTLDVVELLQEGGEI